MKDQRDKDEQGGDIPQGYACYMNVHAFAWYRTERLEDLFDVQEQIRRALSALLKIENVDVEVSFSDLQVCEAECGSLRFKRLTDLARQNLKLGNSSVGVTQFSLKLSDLLFRRR